MSKNNLFGILKKFLTHGLPQCFKEYDVECACRDYENLDKENIKKLYSLHGKIVCLLVKGHTKQDRDKLYGLLGKIKEHMEVLENTVGN